jgi:serine protease Do
MEIRYSIIILIPLIILSFIISGCGGCSQSGIKNRAERNSSRSSESRYSQSKPVNIQSEINNQSQNLQLPLNQLFKKYQSAVFMVFTSDGEQGYQGTGFFVSSDGIAVSNYHVFEGTARGLEIIKTANGQELKVERVLAQSSEDDYIIFKVRLNNNVRFTPIPITQESPEIGEDVFAIGNPHGLEHTLSKGIISGYRDNKNLIQTSTEITHGSSGGPLLNMEGEAVGITTAGVGEANLNIQLLSLKKYFTQNILVYQPGHSYIVTVKRVIDGDTFVIESDERVRLIGIDTPETVHPRRDIEPFGPEASEFTKNAIEGKQVRLEFDVEIYDVFKRLLAYVYVDDVLLNEQLLLEGLAVISTHPPNVKFTERFIECQQIAKKRGVGIWSNI